MDDGQLGLYQWLRFYQQVYELPPTDRPTDDVIDSDLELDRWYASFLQQAAAQASLQKAQRNQTAVPRNSVPSYQG